MGSSWKFRFKCSFVLDKYIVQVNDEIHVEMVAFLYPRRQERDVGLHRNERNSVAKLMFHKCLNRNESALSVEES